MNKNEDTIYDVLTRVIEEEGLQRAEINDRARLVDDLGLKSLHLARVLAMLEMELELDPFASGQIPITRIQTVGDLCAVYKN